MAGGYENEDLQAELEEIRRRKEAQMRAWMDEERQERERRRAEAAKREADAARDDGTETGRPSGSGGP